MRTRSQIWYLLEETFGLVQHDPTLGESFWDPSWDVLEERARKHLGLFKLTNRSRPPLAVKSFIQVEATNDQLVHLLEVVPAVLYETSLGTKGETQAAAETAQCRKRVEALFPFLGVNTRFDRSGGLVFLDDVDADAKDLAALPNRSAFETDVAARAGGGMFSLVFADLDNFKMVNDRNGHPAGDACLSSAARIVGGIAAGKGKVYRYGGDEFSVIFPNFSRDEATATAERIRKAIDDASPGEGVKVTASVGVADSGGGAVEPKALIAAADDAAFASKALGRNRVTTAPLNDSEIAALKAFRAKAEGRD